MPIDYCLSVCANADQQERRAIAQELIDFDYKFSRLFSGKPGAVEAEGVTSDAWKEAWDQSIKFTSGTGVVYAPNQLIAATRKQATQLAKNIILGSVNIQIHQLARVRCARPSCTDTDVLLACSLEQHFESHQVVEVSTAHAVQLQQRLKGDGRWRLISKPPPLLTRQSISGISLNCFAHLCYHMFTSNFSLRWGSQGRHVSANAHPPGQAARLTGRTRNPLHTPRRGHRQRHRNIDRLLNATPLHTIARVDPSTDLAARA